MKLIPLTKGLFAQVDDEDFDYLNQFTWRMHKCKHLIYASRVTSRTLGKRKNILMHCEILQTKGIDHIDGNGLNNQKINLRICSQKDNTKNRKINANNTSGFKGVLWHKRDKKWYASISCEKKRYHLGAFENKLDAAKAYNLKAVELFGIFAKLNKIEE